MDASASFPAPAETVLTVTELTRQIKRQLESRFASLWVEGELSNVKHHSSGHLYFTLKDEGAALRGVMFRGRAARLKFEPEDGQKVRIFGSITVYEPQGSYQINAQQLEPVGIGELEIAFRQLYDRLEKEGLFAAERKRPLPRVPRTIGLVTSASGAAVRDLVSVLRRRAPHCHLVLRPTPVQGAGAAEEIAQAIGDFDEWGRADVLIVGRGGGSLEDLWTFNEEVVARAIVASRQPVISAVGHEVDVTIADFAADLRAPTPSAAAELVSPERDALLREIKSLGGRMAQALTQFLRRRKDRVMLLAGHGAFQRPWEVYQRRSQDVDRLVERLLAGARALEKRHHLRWDAVAGRLHALSPRAVLARGYALVRDAREQIVRRADQTAVGQRLRVELAEGALGCTVSEILSTGEGAPTGERKERG
jgi:exodeoxyribonuclease VII large subunit